MESIVTFEQYKKLTSEARSLGYRNSNCYFLPVTVKEKIARKTLYFEWLNHGLLICDDCGSFYRCYYYLHEEARPKPLSLLKDAVIELPFNTELSRAQIAQIRQIEMLGFSLGRESGMMVADAGQLCAEGDSSIVHDATQEDAEPVLSLITRSFNPLYAFLPDEDEIQAAIEEGRILVIHDGSNAVLAALHSGFNKGVATINQVAVAPQARGHGYGKLIVQAYHRKYAAQASRFQHWVDLHNEAAVAMYQQFGYRFSARRANEYIKIGTTGK